jgi:four helix bundle protein
MSSPHDLRDRTKSFAVRIVRLYRSLPYKADAQVLGKQLLRSGTAVAANYRATCRARSKAEWVAKIGIVVEEADESQFWLEMLIDCELVSAKKLQALIKEGRTKRHIHSVAPHSAIKIGAVKLQITRLQNYKLPNA